MRNRLLLLAASTMLLVVPAAPAQAITNGVPDVGEHPYVGQLLFHVPDAQDSRFDDPGAWYNCSGTLVDETVVVTAGHCTYGTGLEGESTVEGGGDGSGGTDVWVNFAEAPDYSMLNPSSTYAPAGNADRYADWSAALDASPEWHEATAYPHPEYDDAAFYLHDAGVLVLDDPVTMSEYGQLPTLGLLDTYAMDKKQRFTAVGYGLEDSGPFTSVGGDTRRKANLMLVGVQGVYGVPDGVAAKFSSNNGKPHRGGTCFGDSGGPIFVAGTNVITSVTSFGIDPSCAAGGGGYRLDQEDDLTWLATFGVTP